MMKYLKIFEDFSDDYVIWETINLDHIYNYINTELFNDELPVVPIIKINIKSIGARVIIQKSYGEITSITLEVSTYFKRNLKSLYNIMAHEMIHVKLADRRDYGGYHGVLFQTEMDRINKKFPEFNITVKDEDTQEADLYKTTKKDAYFLIMDDGTGLWIAPITKEMSVDISPIYKHMQYKAGKNNHEVNLKLYKTDDPYFSVYKRSTKWDTLNSYYALSNLGKEKLDSATKLSEKTFKQI